MRVMVRVRVKVRVNKVSLNKEIAIYKKG